MIALRFRCIACDEVFTDDDTRPCDCGADAWEPCVVDDAPDDDVLGVYRHHSGVAFFAYDEAAKAGALIPAFVEAMVPDVAKERLSLVERIARLEDAVHERREK